MVREYKERGLPLAVIVSDYFHWHMMGDWAMDPRDWPDPAGMMKELKEMGVELMVSIWPTVNRDNPAFKEMAERGLLAQTVHGVQAHMADRRYHPRRHFTGNLLRRHQPRGARLRLGTGKKNYLDYGVRVFWLDADEPELMPMHAENIRYALGSRAGGRQHLPAAAPAGFL